MTRLSVIATLAAAFAVSRAIELTFELPDNANQCFYEEIKSGEDVLFEFQVVTGGQYDVDLTVEDPHGKILYKGQKKQYDSINFKTDSPGEYKACFSNEFSTFSHKVVYMDWQIGDGNSLHSGPKGAAAVAAHAQATSTLDTLATSIGDKLRVVDDYQTHHRLREATGRKRAEELNERVLIWSLGQTAIVVVIGVPSSLVLLGQAVEIRRILRGGGGRRKEVRSSSSLDLMGFHTRSPVFPFEISPPSPQSISHPRPIDYCRPEIDN
ncbi:hypothetical protein PRIPAC_85932 [Pristionchus pacificus]|uniref:GOLD domain-containing protein n=1 Tax=Pristionchus pacificus TaxID=54126 RepID=A0A2A6BV38_PRIPA|nr:hypothetical protein PRIPAC_85932 [Pristionchus pacificus]|eukprot:PDM69755.1 hypothetical protein PRIPAC_44851 [Pristionchus pacificus]